MEGQGGLHVLLCSNRAMEKGQKLVALSTSLQRSGGHQVSGCAGSILVFSPKPSCGAANKKRNEGEAVC